MAYTTVSYRLYRNEVEVQRGQFFGATQVSYTPPDASPANYRVAFFVDGASPEVPGQIARRTMAMVGYRR